MHPILRALPLLALGAALGAAVAVPFAQKATLYDDMPPQGAWSPCFGNPVEGDSRIVASFAAWAKIVEEEGPIGASDTDVDVVPVGRHQGLWILPGCVAFEDAGGSIVFWRHHGPIEGPTWRPHPRMEDARAEEAEKAALEAEIDARVEGIKTYMDAHDGALPPVTP